MPDQHWTELLPNDIYIVRSNGLIHEYDRKVIVSLYQPLIGTLCTSFYMTLWGELAEYRIWGQEDTHRSLLSALQTNLKNIYEARKKLEGIGLLKTFVRQSDDEDFTRFLYELQPPLTPKQFFDDGVLNVYLYNRIGKIKFLRLKRFFSDHVINDKEYTSITHSFSEVFQSLHPSELKPDQYIIDDFNVAEDEEYLSRKHSAGYKIDNTGFDFNLLLAGLSENMVPKEALTSKVKDAIVKLSYIYSISPIDMKNLLISSLNEEDVIDIEELRKAARDWYQLEHGDHLPALSRKKQPQHLRTMNDKAATTKEEKLMQGLEKVSPYQFLKEFAGGTEPAVSDLKIIEDVMFKQKLNPGVINVLIYYVLLKSDMKLTKGYVEKIAGHWTRKKITTVKEAMTLAKNEHNQYLAWADDKKKTSKKVIRQEMLPEWLKNAEEEKSIDNKKQRDDSIVEAERQQLAQSLQKYKRDT